MCGRENFGGIAFIAMIWRQALQAFNTVQVEKGVGEKLGINTAILGCNTMVPSWHNAAILVCNTMVPSWHYAAILVCNTMVPS